MHSEFDNHFRNLLANRYSRFIEAINEDPVVSVRPNPKKSTDYTHLNFDEVIPWHESAYWLKERARFYADPLHFAGAYYVQEASSMFFANLIKSEKPLLALDLCAAPGGKSTLLLDSLHPESLLVSNELMPDRNKVLVENLNRWGRSNVLVSQNKSSDFKRFKGSFDLVLVDAPCSGEGMFRKDNKSLKQWSPQLVTACAQTQREILRDAVDLLKEEGLLIYSTCTFEPEENEKQVQWIVNESSYEWQSVESETAGAGPERIEIATNQGDIQAYMFPLEGKGEGQFVCGLRKVSKKHPRVLSARDKMTKASRQEHQLLHKFVKDAKEHSYVTHKGMYFAISAKWEREIAALRSLQLRKMGVNLGKPSPKSWIPHHELALTTDITLDVNRIELGYDEAIKYLKGELINETGDETGWYLATYKEMGIGWSKNIGSRWNNYMPKTLRLRKEV